MLGSINKLMLFINEFVPNRRNKKEITSTKELNKTAK